MKSTSHLLTESDDGWICRVLTIYLWLIVSHTLVIITNKRDTYKYHIISALAGSRRKQQGDGPAVADRQR